MCAAGVVDLRSHSDEIWPYQRNLQPESSAKIGQLLFLTPVHHLLSLLIEEDDQTAQAVPAVAVAGVCRMQMSGRIYFRSSGTPPLSPIPTEECNILAIILRMVQRVNCGASRL